MGLSKRQQEKISRLVTALGEDDLRVWVQRIPPRKYVAGQEIFYRNHHPYGLFVIHSGSVDLHLDRRSTNSPVRVGPGSMLGLPLILLREPYPATAVVAQDVMASFAEKSRVSEWLRAQDPILTALPREYPRPTAG